MTNLPNNQIVLDQSNRGTYPREDLETWETGAHEWRSLDHDNPSYFHAVPHKDGQFSSHEHQANGHYTIITDSSHITQQDSRTDGTTNNRQIQTGGGIRDVSGQGTHRERGADDTNAVAGSKITIAKSTLTNLSQEHGHHGVIGDYGFYVKGGGYSVASEQQMVVTSQATIHCEAQQELSLKGIQNMGLTTKGKFTIDSMGDWLANTASNWTANTAQSALVNAAQNITANAGQSIVQNAVQNISLTAQQQITLTVGGSTITMLPNKITLLVNGGKVVVNHGQVSPSSAEFI